MEENKRGTAREECLTTKLSNKLVKVKRWKIELEKSSWNLIRKSTNGWER